MLCETGGVLEGVEREGIKQEAKGDKKRRERGEKGGRWEREISD